MSQPKTEAVDGDEQPGEHCTETRIVDDALEDAVSSDLSTALSANLILSAHEIDGMAAKCSQCKDKIESPKAQNNAIFKTTE